MLWLQIGLQLRRVVDFLLWPELAIADAYDSDLPVTSWTSIWAPLQTIRR